MLWSTIGTETISLNRKNQQNGQKKCIENISLICAWNRVKPKSNCNYLAKYVQSKVEYQRNIDNKLKSSFFLLRGSIEFSKNGNNFAKL